MISVSIDERPNGTYRARWRESPGGAQRTRAFKLKRDAARFKATTEADSLRGVYIPAEVASTTVAEFAAMFLERQVWRSSTREVGGRAIGRAVTLWGDRPVHAIQASDVRSYVKASKLSPASLKTERSHIAAMFKMAVDDGLRTRSPMAGVRFPAVPRNDVVPFTPDEVEALEHGAPGWFRIAVVLGVTLGVRQSELRGLTHDRVRYLRRDVLVDRQAERQRLAWTETKNSVVRAIPTDGAVLDEINHHLAEHGKGEHDLVLHHEGRFITAGMFEHAWRTTRTVAELTPTVRFHDTRHTFASELLSDGVSIPAVAGYLGDTPTMVLKTYGHLVSADDERVRATIRRMRRGASEDSLRTVVGPHPL